MGIIYGNCVPIKSDLNSILESVDICSYDTFIEACYDSSYFMESLVDKFELGIINEAESKKFNIKEMIDNMIEKVKKLWESFIGSIKQLIEKFKTKSREFMEKNNITSVGVRAIMKGFDYSQLDTLNDRLKKVNNGKGFEFIRPKWETERMYKFMYQYWGIKDLFENDFKNIENRISKITSLGMGDAKKEYDTLKENIEDLKKKILNVKNPRKISDSVKTANRELSYKKKKYGGYLPEISYAFMYSSFIEELEDYFDFTDSVSKSDVEAIAKLAEDNLKNINQFKENYNSEWSVSNCKRRIEDCKKSLEKAKKNKNGYTERIDNPDHEYDTTTDTYYVPDGEEYKYTSTNNNIYLLEAKLELQLAQVYMKACTFAYKKQLEFMNKSAVLSVSALLGLKVAIKMINSDKFDPETGDYNGKLIKIKNS